jgi:hypothetical protein
MAFGDFTVVRASTKLRIGSDGLYGSVANNVPAFEFNTDGTYRGLLVEPGATNLVIRSQEFNTWTLTRTTVTADATTAPDGTSTADKLLDTVDANTHFLARDSTVANATVHTLSVFAKKGEYDFMRLEQGNNSHGAYFNLATGAVVGATTYNPTITNVGNGWYRCTVTVTSISTSLTFVIAPSPNGTSINYTGTGTSGIFIWQAQLETGSVATSPIVTSAGTASRVADVVSLTGASSLIGQTSGTMFIDLDTRVLRDVFGGVSRRFLCISDGTVDNRVNIIQSLSNDAINMTVTVGGVAQASISSSADQTGRVKIAAAYAVNDFALYINGVQIGTDTSGTVPACSRVALGSFETTANSANAFATIRSVALFPTRLSNATLASITTP